MKKLLISFSILLLLASCKKKDNLDNAAPELNYAGDASIYSSLMFTGNQTTHSLYWDFGDNTSSVDKEPQHIYTREGTYTIKLTIDRKDTITKPVYISLGLQRIGRQRLWGRKLITNNQGVSLSDTIIALTIPVDNTISLPAERSVSFFNNAVDVYFQKVSQNIISYAAFDSVTNTSNTLQYNAASDVVSISRIYTTSTNGYDLQYTSQQ